MPRTDDPNHAALQKDVDEYLWSLGFMTDDLTYHEKMDAGVAERLRMLDTATAIQIRTRADRVAVHTDLPIVFEYEIKTNPGKYANAAIEALPLGIHKQKSEMKVSRCLYAYRDAKRGYECGFWCHEMPMISCVRVPRRFRWMAKITLPALWEGVEIACCENSRNGSNDPYVLIDETAIADLPSWKVLVSSLVANTIA